MFVNWGSGVPYTGERKVDMKTVVSTFSVACHHMLGRKITCRVHMPKEPEQTSVPTDDPFPAR